MWVRIVFFSIFVSTEKATIRNPNTDVGHLGSSPKIIASTIHHMHLPGKGLFGFLGSKFSWLKFANKFLDHFNLFV